jgi:iron complex transport system ATP-binding protein
MMLRLKQVGAGYHGKPVVRGVSSTVPKGSWLAIIGPNGAGKSTLLKAIAGLVEHTGEVRVDDQDINELSHRERARKIGYSPQTPELPDGLTVTDYVLLGRTPHLKPLAREGKRDRIIATEVLRRLDLEALESRRLKTLSGGERQRAVLARVLAQQAGLLLLDEPTTGLDIGHAQSLLELVDRLRKADGTTVVSTLHDLTLAGQYADRLLLLDNGEVAKEGTPRQVLTEKLIKTHYQANVEILQDVVVAPKRR